MTTPDTTQKKDYQGRDPTDFVLNRPIDAAQKASPDALLGRTLHSVQVSALETGKGMETKKCSSFSGL